jgi:hypothetical protein
MTSGKPVILVIEDEVLVRMMAVFVAEDNGFNVLSAGTADEAIQNPRILPEHSPGFHRREHAWI